MKKVLILEDNRSISDLLAYMVKKVCDDVRIYTADNLKDAYAVALDFTIDLFLIDIILDTSRPGDTSGLIFVERIREMEKYHLSPVVFITSMEDPRLYSYQKLRCYEFIEKPFDKKRVSETIRRCLTYPSKKVEQRTLFFQKDRVAIAVCTKDIVFMESVRHILHIHTMEEIIEVPYTTLKRVLPQVDECGFIQCCRNTIVNIECIENVDMSNRYIGLKYGKGSVEIGAAYKKEVKKALNII